VLRADYPAFALTGVLLLAVLPVALRSRCDDVSAVQVPR